MSTVHSEFSVALTGDLGRQLAHHLERDGQQEEITFATWRPTSGSHRTTALLTRLLLPEPDERILHGNVAFTADYLQRALREAQAGEGLALVHSHLSRGWQGMSDDDVVAERDRVAGAAYGRTGLPLVGLTSGTDGALSARRWIRRRAGEYLIHEAANVREVSGRLHVTFHPRLRSRAESSPKQVATVSVWGSDHQADLARLRIGIVGLGSVGSFVAEGLARLGVSDLVLIDHDQVEDRNLDRTLGAVRTDVGRPKVTVASRNVRRVATASSVATRAVRKSVLTSMGFRAALDCDLIFSCVDRPLPRFVLNGIAYSHLIPVIDGGIYILKDGERFVHADWRAHIAGPGRACLVCLGALDLTDVALDQAGTLDDPDYIRNLGSDRPSALARRNIIPLSMSVAAQEILQMVGMVTGIRGIGGIGPQTYHCYPGVMETTQAQSCSIGCPFDALTATAAVAADRRRGLARLSPGSRPAGSGLG